MKSNSEVVVHIILKEAVRTDPNVCDAAVREIVDIGGVQDVKEKRLKRYGILTGRVPRSRIPVLRALPSVASVCEDEERQVI